MLNMNTQKNQSIFIGDSDTLKLLSFDEDNMRIHVTVKRGDEEPVTFERVVKAGEHTAIALGIDVHYKGIGNNGIQYAMIGFDAPRHIRIVGEWKTGNRDPGPADRAKLSQMSDASLVYYANMHAKTPLEHELMTRFKQRLGK